MMTHQRGGLRFGKDDDDFFSVYSVEVYREIVYGFNSEFADHIPQHDILYTGALFYNHKTKKFHLFTASSSPSYFKVIKKLLGVNETDIFQPTPLGLQRNENYNGGIDYYNEFDGKKWRTLYCHFVTKEQLKGFMTIYVDEMEYDIDDIDIPPNSGPPIKLENKEGDQTFDVGDNEKLTFSRVVTDDEAKKTYQIVSSSIFVRNEKTIKNAVAIATKVFLIIYERQRNKENAIKEKIAVAKKEYYLRPGVIAEAKRFREAQIKKDEERDLEEKKKYDALQEDIKKEHENILKKAAETDL